MIQGIQGPFQVGTQNWQCCVHAARFEDMKNGEVKGHEFLQTALES